MKKVKNQIKKVHSANDFEFINMPHNRRELFFDVLKQRWRTVYFLGIIFFLTLLPTLLVLYFQDAVNLNIYTNISMSDETKIAQIFQYSLFFNGLIALTLLVVPIFLGGILRNFRNLSYEEPVFLKEDFGKGIKDSIGQLMLSSIIYSIIIFGCLVAISAPVVSGIIKGILLSILGLIATPLHIILICQTYVYKNKYRFLLLNSILLYIKYFFWMLLIGVIYFIPITFVLFIGNPIIKYSAIVLYLALIYPLVMLFTVILMNYIFDKGINEKNYPEIANKGIYTDKRK